MNDRLKLLKIHLNAAVAGDQDNIAAGELRYGLLHVAFLRTIFLHTAFLRSPFLHVVFLRTIFLHMAFLHGHAGPDGRRQIVSHGGDG